MGKGLWGSVWHRGKEGERGVLVEREAAEKEGGLGRLLLSPEKPCNKIGDGTGKVSCLSRGGHCPVPPEIIAAESSIRKKVYERAQGKRELFRRVRLLAAEKKGGCSGTLNCQEKRENLWRGNIA